MSGRLALVGLAIAVLALGASARAADEMEDVLRGLGTATAVPEGRTAPDQGTISGHVFDGETGAPVQGATVIVIWPEPEGGGQPRQEVQVTDVDGGYEFPPVASGTYRIQFVKSGYRASTMTGFEVKGGEANQADFPLPPLATQTSDEVLQLEEFVVEASTVGELMDALELRLDADQLLNVMSAEDLSRFASTDVADAIKRVAGVNVVEGKFAIIRGLEDRYSSTLFNGAPVPSPDPDRQSIQLDLFPSEVVSSLNIAKSFGPELPGNSAGGSIDIVTAGYPDEPFQIELSANTGLNDRAYDRFLELDPGSPVGKETDGIDVLGREFGAFLGGRTDLREREVRYKLIANWSGSSKTAEGFRESRTPAFRGAGINFPAGDLAFGQLNLTGGRFDLTSSRYSEQLTVFGGLGLDLDTESHHRVDFSFFWTRKDQEQVELRENGYLPGFDYGKIAEKTANGDELGSSDFFGDSGRPLLGKNASYEAWIADIPGSLRGTTFGEDASNGAPWFASFLESASFDTRRELRVYQLNGDHRLEDLLEGLHVTWAANYATTSQAEEALGADYYYEPCGLSNGPGLGCPVGVTPIGPDSLPTRFPVMVEALGPGTYFANNGLLSSATAIDEEQYFGRLDGDYESDPFGWLHAEVRSGLWYEHSTRDVDASFLDANNATVATRCNGSEICIGQGSQFAIFGDTPQQLGNRIFGSDVLRDSSGALEALRTTRSQAKREIQAVNASLKTTLWERFDVLGGLRFEKIFIESKNDPFVPGNELDASPRIFPSKYLLFDRLDNLARNEVLRSPPYNDQILGIDVPLGPCRDTAGDPVPGGGQCVDLVSRQEIDALVNGEIDETRLLPSLGLTVRPLEGVTLRGAYSRTVARPSFREIGYYVTARPGTDDLSIGNPQLQLSDVESWDARAEYVWGDVGDLVAFSAFYKTIQDPVEQIIVRDPAVFDIGSLAVYRTFFNNPNDATLKGLEMEARKNLGFLSFDFLGVDLPWLGFLHYLSIGGNFTYIDAKVDRSQAEIDRAQRFFGNLSVLGKPVPYTALQSTRRLYNQPRWIANADVSFDDPDWGTKVTLAFFAISDVLDAAGGATEFEIRSGGQPISYFLDRYVDSYQQIDLVVRQELWRGLSLKLGVKNLTDCRRAIVYDPAQTAYRIPEKEYRLGRDYSLELSWTFSGPAL